MADLKATLAYSAEGYTSWLRDHGQSIDVAGVFICDDEMIFPGLIEALTRRGWVRNEDLKSPFFNLKWTRLSDHNHESGAPGAVINHTMGITTLTIKRLFYQVLQDRCLVRCGCYCDRFLPRAFDLTDKEAVEDLTSNFYLTKATCVLQHHVAGKNVSQKALAAAKSVVQRSLENQFIDGSKPVTDPEEACALACGSLLDVMSSEKRELDAVALSGVTSDSEVGNSPEWVDDRSAAVDETAALLARYAEDVGSQFFLQGQAANWWILKPGSKSKSIGIRVIADNLSNIMAFKGQDYVCMKYIERPLLIEGRKQDIRQLVLSVGLDKPEGGQIYFYPEVYSFFADKPHAKGKPDETSHVTGMKPWSIFNSSMYREWLTDRHGPDAWQKVQAQMREIVTWTLQCAQEDIVTEAAQSESHQKTCEVHGYDFEIDENLHVWLLEVNSMPSLAYRGSVKDPVVRAFMEDCIKVLVDGHDIGQFERLDVHGRVMEPGATNGALGPCPLVAIDASERSLEICGQSILGPAGATKQNASAGWSAQAAEQMDKFRQRVSKTKAREQQQKERMQRVNAAATKKALSKSPSLSLPPVLKQRGYPKDRGLVSNGLCNNSS